MSDAAPAMIWVQSSALVLAAIVAGAVLLVWPPERPLAWWASGLPVPVGGALALAAGWLLGAALSALLSMGGAP